MRKRMPAPIRGTFVAAGIALCVLLAVLTDALLWLNATALRGTAEKSAYRLGEETPDIRNVYLSGGVLHMEGALYRQQVAEFRLHAGLIWKPAGGEEESTVTLLSTQMVRLPTEEAQRLGVDDHCGFHAAVDLKRLPHKREEGQYRVVLVDDESGSLADTDAVILMTDGENLTAVRRNRQEGSDEEILQ